ncbi:cdc2-related protein kinase 1 [Plasmodium gonderi]|uniref:Cyclin-dependent kinase 2 homolog n=1 Tax=Plasmodium gonderi TaxID=77519 RepID=A0A1Y1JGB6_PLAGO|nr:cdc2-related protein kinase 1 [Plasmodium gonderi]GAW79802.1 cdc2-related protein kinase 1 [Plasmodium gonderi]
MEKRSSQKRGKLYKCDRRDGNSDYCDDFSSRSHWYGPHDNFEKNQKNRRNFHSEKEGSSSNNKFVGTRWNNEMEKCREKRKYKNSSEMYDETRDNKKEKEKKDQFEKSRYHYYNRRTDENSYFDESKQFLRKSDKRKHSMDRTTKPSYPSYRDKRTKDCSNENHNKDLSRKDDDHADIFKSEQPSHPHENCPADKLEGGKKKEKKSDNSEQHIMQRKEGENKDGQNEMGTTTRKGGGSDECRSDEFRSDECRSDEFRSDEFRSDEFRSDEFPSDSEANKARGLMSGCRSIRNYKRLNKISEGTYGAVFRAQNRRTKRIVALKQLKHFSSMRHEGFAITSLREINILLQLQHENILSIKEVVIGKDLNDIYLVMEYVEHELKMLLDNKTPSFTISELKCLLKQLLSGVDYLHTNWVMHRDLKTTNLLYSNKGVLKICDFGMARKFGHVNSHNITKNVVTLWYRAPELLLGERCYTNKIDIWSVGCIFAEMILKKPLFVGDNEIDQILKILSLLGLPDRETYPEFYEYSFISKNKELFKKKKIKMNVTKIRSHFPNVANQFSGLYLSDNGLDLLQQLLHFNPKNRISASDALKHPYFKEFPKPLDIGDMPFIPDTNKVIRSNKMANQFKFIGQNNIRFHS